MSTSPWNPFVPTDTAPGEGGGPQRRLRIGIFSFTSGEFDSRSHRIARSAAAAGHDVTIYARWRRGLPEDETLNGYRIVRQVSPLSLLLPWGRRQRLQRRRLIVPTQQRGSAATNPAATNPARRTKGKGKGKGGRRQAGRPARGVRRASGAPRMFRLLFRLARRVRRIGRRSTRRVLRPVRLFPLLPLAWAIALSEVVEPADVWHGMWGSSLPVLSRVRSRHGGKTIYDCRDILLRSGDYGKMPRALRAALGILERRWARSCDAIISVNDAYADVARKLFGPPRPDVVMNCPDRWVPPTPRPDRFRETLGIAAATRIALYQGRLRTERGIEQSLEAITLLPDTCLVLLGFGPDREKYRAMAATEPYLGKLYVLDAVPPQELLQWSASADVMVMAILDSSLNHRYTTPQKLFEALAAGVPVVAANLPGMATIVTSTGCGELCDPESPQSIAEALRRVLDATPAARAAYGQRALEAASTTYNWDAQLPVLGDVYARLLD